MPSKEQYSEKENHLVALNGFRQWRCADTLILWYLSTKRAIAVIQIWYSENCFINQTRVIQNCWVALCDWITANSWSQLMKKNALFSLPFKSHHEKNRFPLVQILFLSIIAVHLCVGLVYLRLTALNHLEVVRFFFLQKVFFMKLDSLSLS